MHRRWLLVGIAIGTIVAAPGTARAASSGYVQRAVLVPPRIPGQFGLVSDIVFADAASHRVYLADDANAQVDVWNTRTRTFLGAMSGGFTGEMGFPGSFDNLGPDGVLVDGLGQIWAGNGDGTVKVGAASPPFAETDSVATGGRARADELAYDPRDQIVIVTNPSETTASSAKPQPKPFVTLISALPDREGHHAVLGHVLIPGAGLDSVEQPAWDPQTGDFLISVRETRDFPNGEVAIVDPRAPRLQAVLPLDVACHPAGIALGPNHDALLGCDSTPPVIINRATGRIQADLTGHDACCADEVWFNKEDGRYFAAEGGNSTIPPSVIVIGAARRDFLTAIPISDTSGAFHAVAASGGTTQVFVPESDGIHVFVRTIGA